MQPRFSKHFTHTQPLIGPFLFKSRYIHPCSVHLRRGSTVGIDVLRNHNLPCFGRNVSKITCVADGDEGASYGPKRLQICAP